MQTTRHFINLLILFGALLLLCAKSTYAQEFYIQTSAGVVYLPFYDWSNFASNVSNATYSKNDPNFYYALSVQYRLNSYHFISIGTELIRSTASESNSLVIVDWKFQGIPITLGYEYRPFTFNEHFTPTFGAGISYFISEVDAYDNLFNHTLKRYGDGYGVHASIGLNSELSKSLSLISQIRYRYSNGMAFTDKKGDIKVEFTGFDFNTGLSWAF